MSTLDILVKNKSITKYNHPDDGTIWVEGRKNSEYIIKVHNNNSFKVKAVISVDGLNIMNGEEKWDIGYIVEPNSSIEIPGWRIDANKVSNFVFSDIKNSYNTTNKGNVGVIGCMFFKEKNNYEDLIKYYHYHYHYNQPNYKWEPVMSFGSGSNLSAGGYAGGGGGILSGGISASGSASASGNVSINNSINSTRMSLSNSNEPPTFSQSIGTAWGHENEFKTSMVYVNFEDNPYETLTIYYDSAKGLEKRGIKLKVDNIKPKAFPGFNNVGCKPPSRKYRYPSTIKAGG